MIFYFWIAVYWLYEHMPGWSIFLVIAAAIAWEVSGFYKVSVRSQDPYQQQLTSASHGVAFILLTPYAAHIIERYRLIYMPPEIRNWLWPAVLAFMAFGAYKLILGASRTRMYQRDAQLITRATVKTVCGFALGYALFHRIIPVQQLDRTFRVYAFWLLFFAAAWMVATGITKLVLLIRPWEHLIAKWADDGFGGAANMNAPKGSFARWKASFFKGWHWE